MQLSDFYRDLQAWIDAGRPVHALFSHLYGLCTNLAVWSTHHGLNRFQMRDELSAQFEEAGLDSTYPFNPHSGYWAETERGETWKNEQRLAWVKNHATR